ncbi:MAG TPA: hypothetical protein VF870_11000 [Ignavibacteriaceae bacterium]
MFENNDRLSCKINETLISDYGVSIDNANMGTYWEAVVYFSKDDFTLNAFIQDGDGVKETEVLKIPLKKVNDIKIFEVSYGTLKTIFKKAVIAAAISSIIISILMLLHPEPGYTDIGFILPVSLFLGIGLTLVFLALLFFFHQPKKNICINIITNDKRLITFFTDIEQKEWVMKILLKYFKEVENKGFPYQDLDLN